MNSPRGIASTQQLVLALREAIGSFVSRERALTRSGTGAVIANEKFFEQLVEEETARFDAANALQDELLATVRQQTQNWDQRLRVRIKRLQNNARIQALEQIERDKGREVYAAQHGKLETSRLHQEALAANELRRQELEANLDVANRTLHVMQRKARRAFAGYWSFRKLLASTPETPVAHEDTELTQLVSEFNTLYEETLETLKRFGRMPAPALFSIAPLWLWALILVPAAAFQAQILAAFHVHGLPPMHAWGIAGGLLAVLVIFHQLGKRPAAPLAAAICSNLAHMGAVYQTCRENLGHRHEQEIQRIEEETKRSLGRLDEQWLNANLEAETRRQTESKNLEDRASKLLIRHESRAHKRLSRYETEHTSSRESTRQDHEERIRQFAADRDAKISQAQKDNEMRWQELVAEWNLSLPPLFEAVRQANNDAEAQFPEWRVELWDNWVPPVRFGEAAKFGCLEVNLATLCEGMPQDPRLVLPGETQLSLPMILTLPAEGSLLLETMRGGSELVAGTLNNILLRLLSQSPPGRLKFTIFDPVSLGQNFAGVMHLADYEDNLINNRIWTQASEIEQRLADLNEHMEKIIQMYLRNEYASIREYNDQAGSIAEKYHFLVVADFPVNFSETAIRRLVNIVVSGARCGVYLLIHWDRRQPVPQGTVLDELRRNCICLVNQGHGFELGGISANGVKLVLDEPPAADLSTRFLHKVGESWKDSGRIEVPFSKITPQPEEIWSLDTADEIRVPIGRAGAAKLQYLAVGKATRQHTLIGGKTGSGKSTLFHVIITNLALWCSPKEVEFYLVDFKKGVEFKCYATQHLPHARVIAIESDREFGLGVLQRVDEELRRRGDLFRKSGVQDLASYRRSSGNEPLPRSLLMIDEFQEYFVQDDRVSQEANVLLDRIVRQGRAFGIHVILGSQTLGGAYTLARATMGQMVIRIALQCNEADALLIMDDNNPAPRLLTRPGEGIYNDMAGAMEGNSPFQTVWLSEEDRERYLAQIHRKAELSFSEVPTPFVFEGNAPASIRENALLAGLLENLPVQPPTPATRLWLGAPNAIKGPTEAALLRQGGNNLLIVGQSEESTLALLTASVIAIAAQYPRGTARFLLLDGSAPDTPQRKHIEQLAAMMTGDLEIVRPAGVAQAFTGLSEEIQQRAENTEDSRPQSLFVFVYGLQNFRKLRQEDDFSFSSDEGEASPSKVLNDLLSEGASRGMHVLATCDTYNNVTRYIGRKSLAEIELRVLFQMSANDSASLIDSPKAGDLGLHRALLHNAHEGHMEIFRPYALPDPEWMEHAAACLARR